MALTKKAMSTMENLDFKKLKKMATRSWSKEWDGLVHLAKNLLSYEEILPFYAFINQIERNENLLKSLPPADFRRSVILTHILEAKCMFALRFKWQYLEKGKYPFREKWLFTEFKKIMSESAVRGCLS